MATQPVGSQSLGAHCQLLPGAHLKKKEDPSNRKEGGLSGLVAVSSRGLRFKIVLSKNLDLQTRKDIDNGVQEIQRRVLPYLPSDATEVRVKLSGYAATAVTFARTIDGKKVRCCQWLTDLVKNPSDAQKKDLADLVDKVRNLGKTLWIKQYMSGSDGGRTHLAECSSPWQDTQPPSLRAYLLEEKNKLWFAGVVKSFKADDQEGKQHALNSVVGIERWIQSMKQSIQERMDKINEELADKPNDDVTASAERKEKRRELEQLRNLQKEFENIDREAIYTAIALWFGHKKDEHALSTDSERVKMANTVAVVMEHLLTTQVDPHHVIGMGAKIKTFCHLEDPPSLESFFSEYSIRVGDLVCLDPLQQLLREEEEGRETTKKYCSLEAFIVRTAIASQQEEEFKPEEMLRVLGGDGYATSTTLIDATNQACKEFRNMQKTAATVEPKMAWSERAHRMRNNPAMANLFK